MNDRIMRKLANNILKITILISIVGFGYAKDVYDAARSADIEYLRSARFDGNDLFVPDSNGFIPYELVALNTDVRNKVDMQKHVETMFWLKQYKPEKHVFGKASISLVQAGLNSLGYKVGVADGLIGKKTTDAIIEYQKDNNLAETGKMGPIWLGFLYQNLVKNTQENLNKLGYKAGNPDGMIGQKTLSALTQYRSKESLANPDYPGLDALLIEHIDSEKKTPPKSKNEKVDSQKSDNKSASSNNNISVGSSQNTVNKKIVSPEYAASFYLQAGLKMLGYKIKIDGAIGNNTTAQLMSYQKKSNLTQTGTLDEKTKPVFDMDVVKATQKKLTSLGYDTKGTDGKIGNNTKLAIKKYSAKNGLESKDLIDAELLISLSLGNTSENIGNKNSKYQHVTLTTEQRNSIAKTANIDANASLPKTNRNIRSLVSASEVKGVMVFSRSNNTVTGCSISGNKIPIEWCEPFYPLPPSNHCEATLKPDGEVVNLWCK